MKLVEQHKIASFKKLILDYFTGFGRTFVWRQTDNPYHIVVSEIMLQQTQTNRVEKYYPYFIEQFPSFEVLANSSLKEILKVWQGLGYNRRTLVLQKIAQKVMNEFNGNLPTNPELLVEFPGIGKATAGSICAFAFNMPTIFIETNIRSVFIHHFFNNQSDISDAHIYPLVKETLDSSYPRKWYYALTDYGVMLKKHVENLNRKSKHYKVQSKFEGSDRQIRGKILKILLSKSDPIPYHQLYFMLEIENEEQRFDKILTFLISDKLIMHNNGLFAINNR